MTASRFLDEQGKQIAHSNDHKAGFIDVIWVTTTRERIVQDTDTQAPLRLVRRENGHVAILDDATGWSIELIGYGQDNVAAFAKSDRLISQGDSRWDFFTRSKETAPCTVTISHRFEELSAHVKFQQRGGRASGRQRAGRRARDHGALW